MVQGEEGKRREEEEREGTGKEERSRKGRKWEGREVGTVPLIG